MTQNAELVARWKLLKRHLEPPVPGFDLPAMRREQEELDEAKRRRLETGDWKSQTRELARLMRWEADLVARWTAWAEADHDWKMEIHRRERRRRRANPLAPAASDSDEIAFHCGAGRHNGQRCPGLLAYAHQQGAALAELSEGEMWGIRRADGQPPPRQGEWWAYHPSGLTRVDDGRYVTGRGRRTKWDNHPSRRPLPQALSRTERTTLGHAVVGSRPPLDPPIRVRCPVCGEFNLVALPSEIASERTS